MSEIYTLSTKIPDISIVLPFYSAEKTIKNALDSLTKQSLQNFECILVNNNSSDNGAKIAMELCNIDPRFHLMHEPRQGAVYAFNTGLKIAKGRYIARMDADDWCFPNRFEDQFSFLEKHEEIDVLAGQAEYVPHKSDTAGFERYVNWSNKICASDEIAIKRFAESPIINPTVMWRKEVSDKHGSYKNGDFPEDYELWLRWLQNGVRFLKLNKTLIKWCDSDLRLTRTDQRYSDDAFFNIKTGYLAHWLKINNPFHPEVLVWGASKISRKRVKPLKFHGIKVRAFIDITNKRQLNRQVIHYDDIPSPDEAFVLVYLKEETMRKRTTKFLLEHRFVEGKNYLLVS